MKVCLDYGTQKSRTGIYCKKCGYKHRIRPKNLKYNIKVQNKGWFSETNPPPINKITEETKLKISKTLKGNHYKNSGQFKKGHKTWNKEIKYEQISNEKHHNWKGDNVGYSGIHSWIKRKLGSPSICENCKTTTAKRFD